MTTTTRRVTSADVAREAGVARATVSYVLNRTPHQSIPASTRQRVLDAAERLGYTPSAAARTLKRGRSDVVLCILPSWPIGSAAGELLTSLTSEFAQHALTLVTHLEGTDERDVRKVWSDISPAAVLSYHPVGQAVERAMRMAGVRSVVALFSDADSGAAQFIRSDSRMGRMQADHLIAAGHTRMGYAYPDQPALRDFAEPRLQGVEEACLDAGTAPPDVRMVALDTASAAAAVGHWRSLPEPVTAVCAYNDEVGQALLAGARIAGVQVPRDLAVIGADDIPAAALTSPPLTTVGIDHAAEAARIVETVTAALAGREAAAVTEPADLFRIVVRESA